jgi:hypothetical protein
MTKTTVGYYGSELNKFVDEKCSREMTAINIDLIIYKSSKSSIMIIESKHTNEKMGKGQLKLLKLLADSSELIAEAIGLSTNRKFNFDVYVIIGDYPYDRSKIIRLKDKKSVVVNQLKLISFLEFNTGFEILFNSEEPSRELCLEV